MTNKELEKLIERYERNADNNYRNYQDTGAQKYYAAYNRYQDTADVLRYALQSNEHYAQLVDIRADLSIAAGLAQRLNDRYEDYGFYDSEKVQSLCNQIIEAARSKGLI